MALLWSLSLASLLWLAGPAAAAKDGLVGYGIPLYEDLCCQSCHDSLSALWLNCTTFMPMDGGSGSGSGSMPGMNMTKRDDMGAMPMAMTSDECRASDQPWLQTMAACLRQRCDADAYPRDKQDVCFSTYAVAGADTPTLFQALPARLPTEELAADAMWLNTTSLVNDDLYSSKYRTYKEFAREEYLHSDYSLVIVFVTIGICLLSGALAWTTVLLPGLQKGVYSSSLWAKLQANLSLPPFVGSRRLQPLPGRAGYMPSRALGIFITLIVFLNIVLSAVGFQTSQPNIFFMSAGFELCEYVGNRTGVLSLVNMAVAILFAGRNNPLIAWTGWNQATFLTLHRWTARIATVQVVVHSIVYTMAYWQPAYDGAAAYAAKVQEPFYYWGIIATVTMSLAAGLASLPIRAALYETFLNLHIVLVVVTLAGTWYHIVPHFGFDYGYQVWLYIMFAFWAFDRLARLARVAYRNRFGGSPAVLEAIPGTNGNLLQLTIFPRSIAGVGPGQHAFVYLPGVTHLFWECHPFSVAGWAHAVPVTNNDLTADKASSISGSDPLAGIVVTNLTAAAKALRGAHDGRPILRFLARAHSGATKALSRRVTASSLGSCTVMDVFIEGPYSGHRSALLPVRAADTVICVVGGIGITNALGHLQAYLDGRRKQHAGPRRFVLAWSARETALMEHVRRTFFTPDAAELGVEYVLHCTDAGKKTTSTSKDEEADGKGPGPSSRVTAVAGVRNGRMEIRTVLRSVLEKGVQSTVLACGPGAMTDETIRCVVACVNEGYRVEMMEEAFAW
ncbi:hypothetical protein RB596_007990 [Gaeumannomyces avenae]